MNKRTSFGVIARAFHWVMVLLLIAQYTVAWTMPEIHRGTLPVGLVGWHLSIGTALLALVLARLLWRTTHPVQGASNTPLLNALAGAGHAAIYVLLFAVPIMGWINASSRGYPVQLFGAITLPSLSTTGSTLGHAMGDIHVYGSYILLGIVGVHVLAALYHRLILRDGVMERMLPLSSKKWGSIE
ncbi:cytochrome b [Pandoraea communis]|nr:cytochrome b [Pandoraea communis]MDM8357390.1 cytochrome b [Pandoraea communis]